MKTINTVKYQLLLTQIIDARKASLMTQTVLAEKLGKPQSYVSKIENGEKCMNVVEFIEICSCVGLDPSEVIRKAID